jgi:malonyl-CoA/methylmalonyl-CoA synthetase
MTRAVDAGSTSPLVDLLMRAGRQTPNAVAVVHAGRTVTYAQLEAMSGRIAHVLADRFGVSRGDRVAVQVAKRPEILALNLACLRVGAVYVPLNPSYTSRELGDLLDDAQATLLVCDETPTHSTPSVDLERLLADSEGAPFDFADADCDDGSPAAMLFTSGTTGRPKGAVLTHGNLAFGVRVLTDVWSITSEDVLVHVLPLYHVHGLFVAAYCLMSAGGTMRFVETFDTGEVVAALDDSTLMMGVPTHYTRLLADEGFNELSARRVRLFISGSAPMRTSTHEEFFARTGQRILERYGTTETGMITSNPLDGARRPGTVGLPLPGVEVRVVGAPPGIVEVRGPNVFSGYWNRAEQSAGAFTDDGYFVTGDLGTFDEDGYLEIVGRASDLIISGGLNVYPKEVEQVLDGFAEVAESAVIGVPDTDLGEKVVAVLTLAPGAPFDEGGLRDRARSLLAPYKVPKRIVVVEDLPRNPMGKVEKTRLREGFFGT